MAVSSSSNGTSSAYKHLSEEDAAASPLSKDPEEQPDAHFQHPQLRASWWSRITFLWVGLLVRLGYRKTLELEDLWMERPQEDAHRNYERFQASFQLEREREQPRKWAIMFALHRAWRTAFWGSGVWKLLSDICNLSGPLFINAVVTYVTPSTDGSSKPLAVGLALAFGFFAVKIGATFFINQYFFFISSAAYQTRSALGTAIYNKTFKMSFRARQQHPVGQVTNLMSTDLEKWNMLVPYIHSLWSSSFQLLISIGMLYWFLGPTAIVATVLTLITVPIQERLSRRQMGLMGEVMKSSDKRIRLLTEIMQGIRVIKFFSWEESFMKRVGETRQEELDKIKKLSYNRAWTYFVIYCLPVWTVVLTFSSYALMGNELTAAVVFTSLSLLNQMRIPLMMFPTMISFFTQALISMKRINTFLLCEETEPRVYGEKEGAVDAVRIRDATFEWPKVDPLVEDPPSPPNWFLRIFCGAKSPPAPPPRPPPPPVSPVDEEKSKSVRMLQDINLQVTPGSLTIITGSVGCGKSSLLSAIIGDMPQVEGSVTINGSVAYCAQQAWIQNATVRDNIVFGKPFDEHKYLDTLHMCDLERDLDSMVAGDQTEIGENGINLSGGQKQRINLARAVYSGADIFLLDDPLSAVDPHVAQHLFDKCILEALDGRTRILVTHRLNFVPQADMVVVLEAGRIVQCGTYASLMHQRDGALAEMMAALGHHLEAEEEPREGSEGPSAAAGEDVDVLLEDVDRKSGSGGGDEKPPSESLSKTVVGTDKAKDASTAKSPDNSRITTEEKKEEGAVRSSVYKVYFVAAGGMAVAGLIFALYMLMEVARVGNDFWLANWTNSFDESSPSTHPMHYFISIYCVIALSSALLRLIVDFTVAIKSVRAARQIHEGCVRGLLHAPLSFFESTPTGRIMNRLSKDMMGIDMMLASFLATFLAMVMQVSGTIISVGAILPWFLVAVSPMVYVYLRVLSLYRPCLRDVKRILSVTNSPIFSHFSETLVGLSTIRAYSDQARFSLENEKRLNVNMRCQFAQMSCARWLSMRIESLGMLLVFVVVLVGVFSNISPDSIGFFALSLTYAVGITEAMNWLIRMLSEIEPQLNNVERLNEYMNELEQEDPSVLPSDENLHDWPREGEIVFDNVSMRYKPTSPDVLKNISFRVHGQTRVGVVGRTGAGKSSILATLFRMVRLSGGRILIDGVDISQIGLATLRSRMAIIPQDPVLFIGTVRENLDPFSLSSDEDLIRVLQEIGLAEKFATMDPETQGLGSSISEGGQNLSVGERQLVCLGRALLKKVKILVLDEATSNVDSKTDNLIHRTIQKSFANCTIVTIAHRLHTIVDSHQVLVLDAGHVVEFDTPAELLRNRDGLFASMANKLGPREFAHLLARAEELEASR